MDDRRKRELRDRIWELVEPSIESYGNLIERLMRVMRVKDLEEVVDDMDDGEECDE